MSIALSGLSSSRILGAIHVLLDWFIGAEDNLPGPTGPEGVVS
jgi:hypothetical protein